MAKGERIGSLLLPSSGRCNPDLALVVRSGVPWLHPGDQVLVRPYVGAWLTDGFRIVGVQEWAEDAIPALWKAGEILPLQKWVLVRRNLCSWTNQYLKEGVVVTAGQASPVKPGQKALVPFEKLEATYGPLTIGLFGDRSLALVHDPVAWEEEPRDE
jgi:hypothetical protein